MGEKTYLWYSPTQERNAADDARRPKPGLRGSFSGIPSVKGFCVYLDCEGEPVKVSQVTHDPDHGTAYADMRLIGVSDDDRCLVCHRGTFLDTGIDFCHSKGIEPEYFTLMRYIHEKNQTATYLRRDLSVGKPLKLKA